MEYVCLAEGLTKRKLIPVSEDIYSHLAPNKDYYSSIFIYNDSHKKQMDDTGTLAGIKDVRTNRLVWDFDCKENVELAREDAKDLCSRLTNIGVPAEDIQIAFSGMKGFSIVVNTNEYFTPDQFKRVNLYMAKELATNDTQIFDAARIFRIVGTKHNKSGLFKFPLTMEQLFEVPSDKIKELAADINNAGEFHWNVITLPKVLKDLKNQTELERELKPDITADVAELDFKNKPKGFSNCKWALVNGWFTAGKRHDVMVCLAATYKGMGFTKELTYGALKSAARLQGLRTKSAPFEKEEIYHIVDSIYKPTWTGGTYSCKNQPWLTEICSSLGHNKCKSSDLETFVSVEDISKRFEDYSLNIEKNTIKTGLTQLDEAIQLTIGMPVALLGSPSSGKTSLALNILNSTSNQGISSVFFSMDMYGPLVYMKQIQKLTGLGLKQIHEVFKTDKKKADAIKARIKEEYKHVKFSLKSGHTVQDMRDIVSEYEQQTGDKVKLVLTDYLECISGPYSDATANTSKVAGELRDFSTEMGVCGLTLVQPPKSAGDASCPLTSMRQIKGSSMLEQSFRAILGIHREGFGPATAHEDMFMTINCLKNTMGPLFTLEYAWNGAKGEITDLDEAGYRYLEDLRKRKQESKKNESLFS